MRILICHGYLLRGTGSNMYVQSLARALCGLGHHVLLFCQESDPKLDFVSTFLKEHDGGAEIVWDKETDYPGSCMVFQPDIGGLLPVYVLDSYPWFTVKEFTALTDSELEAYVTHNRRSLERLLEQFVPDAIQVNHAVMLPEIVRPLAGEAGLPYNVVIHGSGIEFAVKKDPRYLEHGASGLAAAARIFVPSEHTRNQVLDVFADYVPGIDERVAFVPPGVDTDLFQPPELSLADSVELIAESALRRTAGVTVGDFRKNGGGWDNNPVSGPGIAEQVEVINARHPDWLPDTEGLSKLVGLAADGGQFLMLLGKLLETKGVQCVLPALPLILEENPTVRLVIVGFGELRGLLELLLDALDEGDLDRVEELCEFGNRHYERSDDSMGPVKAFIEEVREKGQAIEYARLCRGLDLRESVIFTGYLTPDQHRYLLGFAKALIVPSLGQEAFGLVVTEAMAAGTVPIASRHSGLQTALQPAVEIWGEDAARIMLGRDRLVSRIASACNFILGLTDAALRTRGEAMRSIVKMRFSWSAVAARMVELMDENT